MYVLPPSYKDTLSLPFPSDLMTMLLTTSSQYCGMTNLSMFGAGIVSGRSLNTSSKEQPQKRYLKC